MLLYLDCHTVYNVCSVCTFIAEEINMIQCLSLPLLCGDVCSPDGQYVAAGSSDGTVFVWETLTGKMKSRKEHG